MLLLPRPSVHGGAVRAWEGFLEVEKWKGFDKSEGKWHLYGAEVLGFQLVHLFISSSIPTWVMSPPGPEAAAGGVHGFWWGWGTSPTVGDVICGDRRVCLHV